MESQEDEVPDRNVTQQELLSQIEQQQRELTFKTQVVDDLNLRMFTKEQEIQSLKRQMEHMRQRIDSLLKHAPETGAPTTTTTPTMTNTIPVVTTPTVTLVLTCWTL